MKEQSMTCESASAELVAYHFGTIAAAERTALEQHVLGCASCLRAYVELKRDIELSEDAPAPSEAVRQRVRGAIARALQPEPSRRAWRWWERPMAFGLAGAAVIAAMVATQAVSTGPGAAPRTLARHVAP